MAQEGLTPGLFRQLGREYRCRPNASRPIAYIPNEDSTFLDDPYPTSQLSSGTRRFVDQIRILEDELHEAREAVSQKSFELRQEKNNWRTDTLLLQDRIRQLNSHKEKSSAQINQLRESEASLSSKLETQRRKMASVTQGKKKLESRLSSQESKLREVQTQLEEGIASMQRDIQRLSAHLTAKDAAMRDCSAQLETAKQQISALVNRNTELAVERTSAIDSISACWLHRFWKLVALLRKGCLRAIIGYRVRLERG